MNVAATTEMGTWEDIPAFLEKALPVALDFLLDIICVVLIVVIGMKLVKVIINILNKALHKSNVEPGVIGFLCSLAKYALYFVLVMIVLSQFGVTASSVVAVLGSAGLAVGLALQGSLSNFAGGVLILVLKPFVVGDYIVENGGGQEGTVSEIGIFYTKLLTPDNKAIMIPNGALSNSSIVNVSAMTKRRIDITVGVAYDSDLVKVKNILTEVVMSEVARLDSEPANVFVSELADSSVNMGIRIWVNSGDYWDAKWRLTENVKYALDKNGIEIPFPQMDVNIKK